MNRPPLEQATRCAKLAITEPMCPAEGVCCALSAAIEMPLSAETVATAADVVDASASIRAAEILRMRIVDAAKDLSVEK